MLGIIALDTVGLLLRWQLFDHAAHLTGTSLGGWFVYGGGMDQIRRYQRWCVLPTLLAPPAPALLD